MAGAVFEAAGVYEKVIAPMVGEALSWCPGSTAARDFANYYAASSNGALQNITERANQLRCFAEELIEAKRAQCTLPCLSRRARCVGCGLLAPAGSAGRLAQRGRRRPRASGARCN